MKQRTLLLFTFLILLLAACSSAPSQTETPTAIPTQPSAQNGAPQTETDVPRISVEDAKAAFDSGQAIIVDVRSAGAYAEGHAVGAISIPLENFENSIGNLSLKKDQWIITYCT